MKPHKSTPFPSLAIMVALLENEAGEARGETPTERLERNIARAKDEAPIDLGSFAQHADK